MSRTKLVCQVTSTRKSPASAAGLRFARGTGASCASKIHQDSNVLIPEHADSLVDFIIDTLEIRGIVDAARSNIDGVCLIRA